MRLFRKILKWAGIVMVVIIALLLITYLIIFIQTNQRINRKYVIESASIKIPTDSVSLARGAHLYQIRSCADCHGKNLEGGIFMNDPMLLQLTAPNLTKGANGLPLDFNISDWIRVLDHGLDNEGKSLWMMPAHETSKLSGEDLANLIAYCISRPPVNSPPDRLHVMGPLGRVLIELGQVTVLPAEKINHSAKKMEYKPAMVTADYGHYLSIGCQGCHREDMQGGGPLAPGFPDVPNISSRGFLKNWNNLDFIKTIRTGTTPENKKLRNEFMPWKSMSGYSDDELNAIFMYLKSQPGSHK